MSNEFRYSVHHYKFSASDFRNISSAPNLYSYNFYHKIGLINYIPNDAIFSINTVLAIKKIFQIFKYNYPGLDKKDLKVYFIADNIPTLDDFYNKRYGVVYSDDGKINFVDDSDPRIKDFELWLEKVLLFSDLLNLNNIFTKNGSFKYDTEIKLNSLFIKNLLTKYTLPNLPGFLDYSYCTIEHELFPDIKHYVKYKNNNELIKKIVLLFIDNYEEVFNKTFIFNYNLFDYYFKIIMKKPFIINSINMI